MRTSRRLGVRTESRVAVSLRMTAEAVEVILAGCRAELTRQGRGMGLRKQTVVVAWASAVLLGGGSSSARATVGLRWTARSVIGASSDIVGLSCPSASLCVGIDGAGNVVASRDPADDAVPWRVANVDSGLDLTGISCPSPSLCVAVDSGGGAVVSTNPTGGAPAWRLTQIDNSNPGGAYPMGGVSCASTRLCVAVDAFQNVVTSTNPTGGAGAWTTTYGIAPGGYHGGFHAVSCPSESLCVAAGSWGTGPSGYGGAGNIATSTDPTGGRASWHPITLGPLYGYGYDFVSALSCAPGLYCLAASGSGDIFMSQNPAGGAGTWTTSKFSLTPVASVTTASCPTASHCVLTDSAENVYVSDDPSGGVSTWLTTRLDNIPGPTVVACASQTLCFAVHDRRLFVGHIGPLPPLVAQVRAQLRRDLARTPSLKIASVLRHHGTSQPWTALVAGEATVTWSYPATDTRTGQHQLKPRVLVATGRRRFTGAGHAQVHVRLTAEGMKLLKEVKRRVIVTMTATFTRPHRPPVAARTSLVLER